MISVNGYHPAVYEVILINVAKSNRYHVKIVSSSHLLTVLFIDFSIVFVSLFAVLSFIL